VRCAARLMEKRKRRSGSTMTSLLPYFASGEPDPSLRSELALEPFAPAQGKLREGMTEPDGLFFEMYWAPW
jgi:hypothetical protein